MTDHEGCSFGIDSELCFGSGECVLAAPEVFEIGPDGISQVREGAPHLDVARARRVVENCPSGALSLFGDDGSPRTS